MVREMEYFITPVLIVFKLENFEDTKGVVRIHKSKKDRQHKRQKKRDKTKNDYIQNITQKIKHRAKKKNTKTLGFKKKKTLRYHIS